MKIDTRGSGRSPNPSSFGGIASTTRLTRPSAGATTMPSRRGVALTVPHAVIEAAIRQQLVMGAALDDRPFIEHDDVVRLDYGREAMRDDERGAVLRYLFERVLDVLLGMTIERGGGLVEHQD